MKLDFTKPLFHKRSGQPARYLGTLDRPAQPIVVAIKNTKTKGEHLFTLDEDELINRNPERWGNVYEGKGMGVFWHSSQEEAHKSAAYGCIGVLHDKGDGSQYTFWHYPK